MIQAVNRVASAPISRIQADGKPLKLGAKHGHFNSATKCLSFAVLRNGEYEALTVSEAAIHAFNVKSGTFSALISASPLIVLIWLDTLEMELEDGALGSMKMLRIEFEFAPELADQASTIFGADKKVHSVVSL